ncbi:MAG: heme utilization cystosolic carrier protein HutX [Pseudomonadota bacterium]
MSAPSVTMLADHLAKHPDVIVEHFAQEAGVTPREVVHALPAAFRTFAGGAHFVEVMNEVARWGDVTLIVHTDDGIMEFGGPIPAGQVSRGYYNIPGTTGFHGHIRHERCAEIAFVERPFMGRHSASILFFNRDGTIMFKIFVGRDANRELKPDQLQSFRRLAQTLSK